MGRSERLQPIAKLAEQGEKDAARELGQARQRQTAEEARLADLQAYRREYISDFQRRGRAGLNGAAIQQFQQFLAQLDKAIEQQQRRLQGSATEVQQSTAAWQARSIKAKAMDNALLQVRAQEAQQQERREQKAVDERNLRTRPQSV